MKRLEEKRLEALRSYHILDSEPEREYDEIAKLAALICECTMAFITLIDDDRQWFKAKYGSEGSETQRCFAFCNYTIQRDDLFEVCDATQDHRFFDNPYVLGDPHIRFYLGAPLINKDGYRLGSLCVVDREIRNLNDEQKNALKVLSTQVVNNLELRKTNLYLEQIVKSKTQDLVSINARLNLTNQQYKSLAENSIDTILRLGRRLNLMYMNRNFSKGAFYHPDLFLGKHISAAPLLLPVAELIAGLCGRAEQGRVITSDYFEQKENNFKTNFYSITCIPEYDELQNVASYLVLLRDISELKEKEIKLLQVNQELDRFVYSASHELKAPVKNVLGILSFLEHDLNGHDLSSIPEYISGIHLSADKMDATINNIIDYSKNNRIDLVFEKIEIEQLLQRIIQEFATIIEEHRILITKNIQPLATFISDKNRIYNILFQLISNAIVFRDPAKAQASVDIYIELNQKECIMVVTDNGEGIKPQFQSRIFDMFFRASNTSTGAGLGLYVTKEMIGKLHGTITLHSETGVGTTFRVTIPNITTNDLI